MPYEWDVFLSYRRFLEWPKWVGDHFYPLFRFYLGEELGHDPSICFDRDIIEAGVSWPYGLAQGLARSKAMVGLWSRQYFGSGWCKLELTHMRNREKAHNLAGSSDPGGLVVPVTIHDGEDFPQAEKITEPFVLSDVVNVRMALGSSKAEALADRIGQLAKAVKKAIDRAPQFDPNWEQLAAASTTQAFWQTAQQDEPPSLG